MSKSRPNLWTRLWQLPWRRRWLVLHAALLVPLVGLELRTRGIRRYRSLLQGSAAEVARQRQCPCPDQLADARFAARVVRRMSSRSRHVGPCLLESITLWRLLKCQGIDSRVRIGVQREAEKLEAHAWVECQGIVINDTADVANRFALLSQVEDSVS